MLCEFLDKKCEYRLDLTFMFDKEIYACASSKCPYKKRVGVNICNIPVKVDKTTEFPVILCPDEEMKDNIYTQLHALYNSKTDTKLETESSKNSEEI